MANKHTLRSSLLATIFLTFFLAFLHFQKFLNDSIKPPSLIILRSNPDPNRSLNSQEPITVRHVSSVSVLLPDWEVLLMTLDHVSLQNNYTCSFPNNLDSRAVFSGRYVDPTRMFFRCELPKSLRRRAPFPQPVLSAETKFSRQITSNSVPPLRSSAPELLRWDRLVYDSLVTKDEIILFAKGINRRQGSYRAPEEFNCIFGDDKNNMIKTAVISSAQEVFKCKLPDTKAISTSVKVSLEFAGQNSVVQSVAYYTPGVALAKKNTKSFLCACTMVYDVAKFLREWVVYHSSIGVERFILYDNNSDDELYDVVKELVEEGYDVSTILWIWPKTQEAGFSHSATLANDSCKWMMYTDVDEFVYSPAWADAETPSPQMLRKMLPQVQNGPRLIGQVLINCHEFGPSNQEKNPIMGVTQGYNYRRKLENRHKSIVLLDAIDESLLNVIHHFKLKENYHNIKLGKDNLLVNHYKYQAWPEFRMKFRRRVSAYVADWTKAVNPRSQDRAPGLGYTAVQPEGWSRKFCETRDDRLKNLTLKWFKVDYSSGYKMAWQQKTLSLA